MMAKHVFLSFVVEDKALVDLFRGQAKNKNSELEFDDFSVTEPFDSTNADYIRTKITEKIRRASITICLIGETTYKSRWVKWEIEKSDELGKRLLGVRLHSDPQRDITPQALTDAKAKVVNWDIDDIMDFIDED
jgi:hypothetical protein